jgi:WD40 repeat protein
LKHIADIRKLIQLKGHNGAIYCLTDIPGHNFFLSAGGDGWIVQWDKEGASPDGILLAQVEGKIFAMCYLQDKELLVAGDFDGDLYWIDMPAKKVIRRVRQHQGSIFAIGTFSKYVYSIGADGFVVQWSVDTMLPVASVKISKKALRSIVIDTKNEMAFIGSSDSHIYIVNLNTLNVEKTLHDMHASTVFSLALSEGMNLFSGGRDAQLKKIGIADFNTLHQISAHWYTINRILYLSHSDLLITASRDKTFRVWDASDLSLLKSVDMHKGGHINSVNTLLYFENEKILATGSDDRSVILWKLEFI